MKAKIALCYCTLLEKMGVRIKNFKDSNRLIRAIVGMLDEGALEVRNQAKIAISLVQSNLENQRQFETLLIKAALSEKQITQVRKVCQQMDGTSQVNTTRYGNIRGSSLDSRGFQAQHSASQYMGATRKWSIQF